MLKFLIISSLLLPILTFDMHSILSRSSSLKRSSNSKPPEGTPVRMVEPSHFGMNSSPRKLKIDSLVDPSKAEGPSHLLQLRGHCFKLENEDYTFEFCPFYNVSQREVSTRWNPYYGLLGVWSGWIFQNVSDYIGGMEYTHGDKCGEGGYKRSHVMFQCSGENNSLHFVNETERCVFKFIFLTQLVCRREWSAVFHHLEEKSREAWLQAQLDHSLGYLTEKGVCQVKREILQEVGWVRGLNLTRLKDHENEKKDQSLYDRTSYIRSHSPDCSACQQELKIATDKLNHTLTLLHQVNSTLLASADSNAANSSLINSLIDLLAYTTQVTDPPNITSSESINMSISMTNSFNERNEPLQEGDSPLDELVEIENEQNPS